MLIPALRGTTPGPPFTVARRPVFRARSPWNSNSHFDGLKLLVNDVHVYIYISIATTVQRFSVLNRDEGSVGLMGLVK